jgi:hypothetical protein
LENCCDSIVSSWLRLLRLFNGTGTRLQMRSGCFIGQQRWAARWLQVLRSRLRGGSRILSTRSVPSCLKLLSWCG